MRAKVAELDSLIHQLFGDAANVTNAANKGDMTLTRERADNVFVQIHAATVLSDQLVCLMNPPRNPEKTPEARELDDPLFGLSSGSD